MQRPLADDPNWLEGPPLDVNRAGHSSTTYGDKVYVVGGRNMYA